MRMLGVQEPTLRAALGNEFRVRMAQAALVGYDPNGRIGHGTARPSLTRPDPLIGYDPSAPVGQVPMSITPYEFWEYYRKNRTELSLKRLPLPVRERFLPEVKDAPSEAELESLFEKNQ